jgi:hypothetical protein
MLLALALAALTVATQPPPTPPLLSFPIPAVEAEDGGWWNGGVEVSTQLLFRFVFGYRQRKGGEEREQVWRPGGLSGAWDTRSETTEQTRTTELKRVSPGPGPAAVTRVERFLSNQSSLLREMYQSRWGQHVNVSYWWYPIEGISLYVGCDLSRLDLYVGIRFFL